MAQLIYECTGTLDSKGTRSADLIDKTMNKYLKIEEDIPVHMMQFFKKEKPDTENWKHTSIGSELGMPFLRGDTDPVPFGVVPPGYSYSADLATYQLAIAITDRLMKYDRSGQTAFIMSGLPKSFKKFYEALMTNVLETAYATTGSDGVVGFSASHPHRAMGSPVWSNLEATAKMASTSVNSMWVNVANRRDATGFPRRMRMTKIFGPTAWREKMVQLANSDKVPESNVNATNAYKGMQYEVAETLTASSTAWYGVGDLPEAEWGMHLIEWQAPSIQGMGLDPNYPLIVKRYFGYCRTVAGMSIPSNLHYNAGV